MKALKVIESPQFLDQSFANKWVWSLNNLLVEIGSETTEVLYSLDNLTQTQTQTQLDLRNVLYFESSSDILVNDIDQIITNQQNNFLLLELFNVKQDLIPGTINDSLDLTQEFSEYFLELENIGQIALTSLDQKIFQFQSDPEIFCFTDIDEISTCLSYDLIKYTNQKLETLLSNIDFYSTFFNLDFDWIIIRLELFKNYILSDVFDISTETCCGQNNPFKSKKQLENLIIENKNIINEMIKFFTDLKNNEDCIYLEGLELFSQYFTKLKIE